MDAGEEIIQTDVDEKSEEVAFDFLEVDEDVEPEVAEVQEVAGSEEAPDFNDKEAFPSYQSSGKRMARVMDATQIYLNEIGFSPLLSAEDEVYYARLALKGDEAARKKMIESNLRLVVKISRHYLNRGLPLLDLIEEGNLGLMKSVEKFDPERGVKFETFASRRIKGSIIDVLRKEDFLPKNVREQAKKIEQAYHLLESNLGRKATEEEIIRELRMTKKEFYGILDRLKGITLISLEAGLLNKQGEKFCFEDIIGEQSSVIKEFERAELIKELAGFIENLEREERIVLETYYWDELTLKEIGKVLGISESRVCQIHTKIILKLRSSFRKFGQER